MIAGNPIVGFVDIFGNYMIPKIADPWNAGVIAMTLFVGCFSVMLERGGGAGRLVRQSKIRLRRESRDRLQAGLED